MAKISKLTGAKAEFQLSRSGFAKLNLLVFALGLVGAEPALADLPKPAPQSATQDPQVKQLMNLAGQAIRQNNLPLAAIQLKNALRSEPNNGEVRALLGTVMLQIGDAPSAERELRQARTNGAKDQDVLPALLQAMVANREFGDLLAQFPDPAPADKSKMAAVILRARAEAYQYTGDAANATTVMDRSLAITRDVPGLLTRAQISIMQNQPQAAMKLIDQAIAMAPDNVSAQMMKATVLRLTDKKGSLAILDGVLKTHADNIKARIEKIEILLELNQNDEAQKNIDAVLAQSPDQPLANFYQALLLGIHNKAREGWRIAQSLQPEFIQSDARIAIGVSQLASASGNMESANAILTAYVLRNPNVLETRLRLAALRVVMNNAAGALETLTPVMNSTDPRALELIAAVYNKLNQPQNVAIYLRKAVAAGSKSSSAKYQLALADIRGGDSHKGAEELIDLVKQTPGDLSGPGAGINLLITQGKIADAQTVIDQAEKVNPKNAMPPYFRALILVSQGKLDNALAMFGQSLARDANYQPALYGRAQLYVTQKKYKEATDDLMHAQASQPNNPLSYVKLGEIAAQTGKSAQAVTLLKTAVTKAPNAIDVRLVLARYQMALTQFADAQQTLKDALRMEPGNAQALALLGSVQQRLGLKSAAVDTNKTLVQKYQQSGAAQYLLASSLLANGDKKGALAALKRAVELSPDVLQYRAALIDQQFSAGDGDGALATARSWAALHKGADGAVMVIETMMRLKRLPEAAALVRKAQAEDPDWQLVLLDSQIAMAQGDKNHAVTVLKNWLASHSTDLPIRQVYATDLLLSGNNAESLKNYEIVLKSKNNIPDVLNNMAWLLKDSDPGRALALASKAWQISPNSSDVVDTYGWLLLRKGDANTALPVLKRAHTLDPDNGEISYHLAMALSTTGNKADAKALLKGVFAKSSNFNNADAARKLLQSL